MLKSEKVFYENEEKYNRINEDYFENFIHDFCDATNINLNELIKGQDEIKTNIQKFDYLKYIILNFKPRYVQLFYHLLRHTGYYMKSEIIDIIRILGREENPKDNHALVNYILECPLIKSIMFDGDKIIIDSVEGKFSFSTILSYLRDNKDAYDFVKKYNLEGKCHQGAEIFLDFLDNAVLVTSLVPHYFEGTNYHSYVKIGDKICDPSLHAVFDSKYYIELLRPYVISSTLKDEFTRKYQSVISTNEFPQDCCKALVLALNEQIERE